MIFPIDCILNFIHGEYLTINNFNNIEYYDIIKMSKLRNSTFLLSLLNVVCVLNLVRVRTETS